MEGWSGVWGEGRQMRGEGVVAMRVKDRQTNRQGRGRGSYNKSVRGRENNYLLK